MAGALLAHGYDPALEAENYAKIEERQTIYDTADYQLLLREVDARNAAEAVAMQAGDPQRNFIACLCARGDDGCAGDARLYDWQAKGYGIVQPVLFTARSSATISGHVWACTSRRPRGRHETRCAPLTSTGSLTSDCPAALRARSKLERPANFAVTRDSWCLGHPRC